jgi:hypothetical protein
LSSARSHRRETMRYLAFHFFALTVCVGCGDDSGSRLHPPDAGIELVEGGWPGMRGLSLAATHDGAASAEEKARILYLLELKDDGTQTSTQIDRFVRWPHLQVDDTGHYHIVYWNGMRKAISYATNASGAWTVEDIFPLDDCFVRPRVSIDGDGAVHVAMFDYENFGAVHMTNKSGEWETDTVPISTDWYVDFACGGDNVCYLAFYDIETDSHRVAVLENGAWEVEVVDDRQRLGQEDFPSITVGEKGEVHMLYINVDGFQHASKTDGAWEIEQLEWQYVSGYSVKTDRAGNVHVLFRNGEMDALQHAVKVGDEWQLSPMVPGYLDFASFDTDDSGEVRLAYWGIVGEPTDLTGGLVYVREGEAWTPRLLDRGFRAGYFVDLTCNDNGAVYIAHMEHLFGTLRLASNASGTWDLRLLDDADWAGEYAAVCVGKDGRAHISEIADYDDEQDKLRHVFGKNNSWTMEDVVEKGDYTKLDYTSIAEDERGDIHLAFREWKEGGSGFSSTIKYAVRNLFGSWTFETVYYVDGQAGDYLDMALDGDGASHLAFFDFHDNDIKHAVKDGGIWRIESASENVGGQTRGVSLAVDRDGKAHISFLHGSEIGLAYVTNRSSVWETRILDRFLEINAAGDTSIAADGDGHVHISYVAVEEFNPILRYATDRSGQWHVSDIDSAGWVGEYNSIAVDERYGAIHIAYSAEDSLWHAVFYMGAQNMEPLHNVPQ